MSVCYSQFGINTQSLNNNMNVMQLSSWRKYFTFQYLDEPHRVSPTPLKLK